MVGGVLPDQHGPAVPQTLRRLGHGPAVDDILSANPTHRTAEVPQSAEVLLDELTVWGDDTSARLCLDRWFAAGAQLPVLTLPPNRPLDELDHMLESLRPRSQDNLRRVSGSHPTTPVDATA